MLQSEITKENLNTTVVRFYTIILQDAIVGPFFIEKLGDDLSSDTWQTHMTLITNFWAAMMLGDTAYRGNPFAPHMQLKDLKRETFEQWIKLFFGVLDGIYTPDAAEQIKGRAMNVAGNFMRNLGV